MRYLDRLQPLALLLMRLALGAIMVAHGYHKVFGGLHHHAQMVGGLGLPAWLGYVSSFAEFLGGLLILAGFFTRAAAFAVCVDLAVAIWKVHLHNGLIGSPDRPGYELPLAAAALACRPDLLWRRSDRPRPCAPRRRQRRVQAMTISAGSRVDDSRATSSLLMGLILRLFRCVDRSQLARSIDQPRRQLNSGAVEIMMNGSPMHLHPNGLAVASYRQERSITGGFS